MKLLRTKQLNCKQIKARNYALEPRVLFDGAAFLTAENTLGDNSVDLAGDAELAAVHEAALEETDTLLAALRDTSTQPQRRSVVVIDSSVNDVSSLYEALPENAEVILLGSHAGGLEQLSQALTDQSNIDSLHIISHGEQGALFLGNSQVSLSTLAGNQTALLESISASLSEDADILIYGCDLAATEQGRQLVDEIANITGADVAASTDDTGHADFDADWHLEYESGEIETDTINAPFYRAILAPPVIDLDLNDSSGATGVNYKAVYESGNPAISVVDSDINVIDADGDDIASVSIAVTGMQQSNVEIVEFDGDGASTATFTLNSASATQNISIGSNSYDIGFDGINFQISAGGGGALTASSVELLLNTMSFETTGPMSNNRSFVFTVVDENTEISSKAVSTLEADSDSDGIPNDDDIDDDNDGILDVSEGGTESGSIDIVMGKAVNHAGSPYTLGDSSFFEDIVSKLANPDNFGPLGAINTHTISVGSVPDLSSTIDANYIDDADVFFDGWLNDGKYSAAELNAIETYVSNGGVLISTSDNISADPLAFHFGLPITNASSVNAWTITNTDHPIINGELGLGTDLRGSVIGGNSNAGYFSNADLLSNDIVLATHTATGNATIVLRSIGDGWALFIADIDIFSSFGVNSGPTFSTSDNEGQLIAAVFDWVANERRDTDSDGIADQFDLDSDNDGISDMAEAGATPGQLLSDANNDGNYSVAEIELLWGNGNADSDNDGLLAVADFDLSSNNLSSSRGFVPVDTDADTLEDFIDLDSDNDGIADSIEGRATSAYDDHSGSSDNVDSDGDGVLNMYDSNSSFGGTHSNFNAPIDSDNDGTADYQDLDSDNDLLIDSAESGLSLSGVDNNNDGIDDNTSIGASYTDPDGVINTPFSDLLNVDSQPADVDYRSLNLLWSITGPTNVDEGASAVYTINHNESVGVAGNSASIEIILNNSTADSSDYDNFNVAMNSAVAVYNADATKEGTVSWNGATLSFTATNSGDKLSNFQLDLGITNDVLVEGNESFNVSILNAANSLINTSNSNVITTINDTQGNGGASDGPATWSLTGASSVDEGASIDYTLALSNALGANEVVSVDLAIDNVDTIAADYANFSAAVSTAVSAYNSDASKDGSLNWDGTTLAFTAANNGDTLSNLLISLTATNDGLLEGNEDYTVSMSNAASTSGAAVAIGSSASITTTISDDHNSNAALTWSLTGANNVEEGGLVSYTVALSNALGANVSVSVDLDIANLGAVSDDYSNFSAAVLSAVAAYNNDASKQGSLSWDGTKLTFTATNDGDAMSDLVFSLTATNDAYVEGDEDYTVSLSNAASTSGAAVAIDSNASITTTIADTRGVGGAADGPATWSVLGTTTVDEGGTSNYTVSLSSQLGAGENASVDLAINNIDTAATDYADFSEAVLAAVAAYNNDANKEGSLNWDGTKLTFTALNDGESMSNLLVSLSATNDTFVEGDENYSVSLSNAASTSGAAVVIGSSASVTTTLFDTQGVGGAIDGPATWSLLGGNDVDEGGSTNYIVSLSSFFGADESISVDLVIDNVDTVAADYQDISAAVLAAVTSYNNDASKDGSLSWDGSKLTFTSVSDGDAMSDLHITLMATNDVLIEGDEDYTISLNNAASASGAAVAIGSNASVTTTIADTQGSSGPADGPATWSLSGGTEVDEGGSTDYVVSLSNQLGADNDASVELSIANVDTFATDYTNFSAAVVDAVTTYNNDASKDGSLSWDGNILTFTASNDGDAMGDLTITIQSEDDAIMESDEAYVVGLANAASSTGAAVSISSTASVTTVISDTQGVGGPVDGPVYWSVTGDQNVDEGGSSIYTIAMSDNLGLGHSSSIDLSISDVSTTSLDYDDFNAAVTAAVTQYAANGEPGVLSWDGNTLTFVADVDDVRMSNLDINLLSVDDSLVEGIESFKIELSNAVSTAGISASLDATDFDVTTVIKDTVDNGGPLEHTQWALTGDTSVSEDDIATYTLQLDGTLAIGETSVVQIATVNVGTSNADYSVLGDAINTAIVDYSGSGSLSYNAALGEITYTSDGAAMTELSFSLTAVADSLAEGVEKFRVELSNPSSTTGAETILNPASNAVQTAINVDDTTAQWSITGDDQVDEGGTASYTVELTQIGQSGEIFSIEVALNNVETDSTDYATFAAAVQAGVAAYTGSGSLAFDSSSGVISFTSDGNAMSPWSFSLGITDDSLVEGLEKFDISLTNPDSSTGAGVVVDSDNQTVQTSISDTVGVGGPEERVTWSIGLDQTVVEGADAVYTISLDQILASGEDAFVSLSLQDSRTNSDDYDSFVAAVNAGVATYNLSGPGVLSFNSANGILRFSSDGSAMGTLSINHGTVNDAIAEGFEEYTVRIDSPGSDTGALTVVDATEDVITTTIDDTVGAGLNRLLWAISGATEIDEGSNASYTVSMSGVAASLEQAQVTISLNDLESNSDDYINYANAISDAVSAYSGPGSLSFNTATHELSFISDGNSMGDLVFSVAAANDVLTEGPERFNIALSDPISNTDVSVGIESGQSNIHTAIVDTATSVWSIATDAQVNEGGIATFTVSLANTLQLGEEAHVRLKFEDIDTTSTDRGVFDTAVTAAIESRTDLSYSASSGILSFTSDGNPFTALDIAIAVVDDTLVEGSESMRVILESPHSTTGSEIIISATDHTATTTIKDTIGNANTLENIVWSIAGDSNVDEGGSASYTLASNSVMQLGEEISVVLGLSHENASSSDHDPLYTAVSNALSTSGRTDLSFDTSNGTLTFVSAGTKMPDFTFTLDAINDSLLEGPERYQIDLSGPTSSTGIEVDIDATAFDVLTEINDTQTDGGSTEEAGLWAVSGPASVDEGGSAVYIVSLSGVYGFNESVSIGISINDIDTNDSDYGDFLQAVQNAVDANADVSFDALTGTLHYVSPSDGGSMSDLTISLAVTDDMFSEGPEQYAITLANASSSTEAPIAVSPSNAIVSTMVRDTQGDDGVDEAAAVWTLTGSTDVDEGGVADYTLGLNGSFGENESISVTLALQDISTTSNDYASVLTAISGAVDAYAGSGSLQFNAATNEITFTSGADGDSMDDVPFGLNIVNDSFIEFSEQYRLSLSASASSTGITVTIDAIASEVTTAIADTDGVGGTLDGPAMWSISGTESVSEGSEASYVIDLSGSFGAGQTSSVDLSVNNISTASNDYTSVSDAIATAVLAYNSDTANEGILAWDGTTLEYTALNDDDSFGGISIDVTAINDTFIEGDESVSFTLSNVVGNNVILSSDDSVTTIIHDTQGSAGEGGGPAVWSVTGSTMVDEGGTAIFNVALSETFGAAQSSSVDITLTDLSTNNSDYNAFSLAVDNAVTAYNNGSNPGEVLWDGTSLTFNAINDGDAFAGLNIEIGINDDLLIEGSEAFSISLNNAVGENTTVDASSNLVTTAIADTQGVGSVADGPSNWSITGNTLADEGDIVSYSVNLFEEFGAGVVSSVNLSLLDINTSVDDYADFNAAVTLSVGNYNASTEPGVLHWDGSILTFTSENDGDVFSGLTIALPVYDDELAEGEESYNVALTNANGVSTTIDPSNATVTTVINDTNGAGGGNEGLAQWSINGDSTNIEGRDAIYYIAMTGTLGANEVSKVDVSLVDHSTSVNDYAGFNSAVASAVTQYNAGPNPGSLDWAGKTLTFTSGSDGGEFSGIFLNIATTDDTFVEGQEVFEIALSNPASTTGLTVSADTGASFIRTTILDTNGTNATVETALWSVSGPVSVAESASAEYIIALYDQIGANNTVSVNLSLTDITTNSTDYASFNSAIQNAIGSYAGDGTVSYNSSTQALSFTAISDGDSMGELSIVLPISEDALVEGTEHYSISLSQPLSNSGASVEIDPIKESVISSITDTDTTTSSLTEAIALWSITGDQNVDEGGETLYRIALNGELGAGISVSTEVSFLDIDTDSDDHENFTAALGDAVENYNGAGVVSFSGSTLTYTALTDGDKMNLLSFSLPIADDNLAEGSEVFSVQLSNAIATGDASAAISSEESLVSTIINDTAGEGGNLDGPSMWSIVGPVSKNEGTIAHYVVSLQGSYQIGKSVSVAIELTDLSTNSTDHGDFIAALQTSVAARSDVSFDTSTNELTFVSLSNGSNMTDLDILLPVLADSSNEHSESFAITLSNPSSTTGILSSLNMPASSITTTITSAPILTQDFNLTSINVATSGNVLVNDIDLDDEALSVSNVNGAVIGGVIPTGNGSVIMSANGDYIYTPSENFVGTDTFTYEVCDSTAQCGTAEVTIEVRDSTSTLPGSSIPIVNNDYVSGFMGQPIKGYVLGNDGDPFGGTLTVNTTPVSLPRAGEISIDADGHFSYKPYEGFVGQDSFEYEACDAAGNCDTAWVILNISVDSNGAENNNPDAVDDLGVTKLNVAVSGSVLENDSDANNDVLEVVKAGTVSIATGGYSTVTTEKGSSVELSSNGGYTYRPAVGFIGTESVSYEISDGFGGSDSATLYLSVFDQAPEIGIEVISTSTSSPTTGNILTNAKSEPLDPLSVVDENGETIPTGSTTTYVTTHGGSVEIYSQGNYVYTPPIGFVGIDTVSISVCDTGGNCVTTEYSITISETSPITQPDTAITVENTSVSGNVLSNDRSDNGDVISVVGPTGEMIPTGLSARYIGLNGGELLIESNGDYTYTPPENYLGADSITITVCDEHGNCTDEVLTVSVINLDPVAVDDGPFTITEAEQLLNINVLGNDTDPDNDSLSLFGFAHSTNGGVIESNANGTLNYMPPLGFLGTDTVIYYITDNKGGLSSAEVSITVVAHTPPPAMAALIPTPYSLTTAEEQDSVTETEFSRGGSVRDMANMLSELNALTPDDIADGIIASTVNKFQPLDGIDTLPINNTLEGAIETVGATANLYKLADQVNQYFDRDLVDRAASPMGFSGFSLYHDLDTHAGTDIDSVTHCSEKIALNSAVDDAAVYLRIGSHLEAINETTSSFKEYHLRMANGRALPEWMVFANEGGEGLLLIIPPEKGMNIELILRCTDDQDQHRSFILSINLDTGEMVITDDNRDDVAVSPTFERSIESLVYQFDRESAKIQNALDSTTQR